MPAPARFLILALALAALHLVGLQLSLAAVAGISPLRLDWEPGGILSVFCWFAIPAALAQAAVLTLPAPAPAGGGGGGASLAARATLGALVLALALALPVAALADLPEWLGVQLERDLANALLWSLILGTVLTWGALSLLLTHRAKGAPDLLERRVAQATAGTLVGLALAAPWYLVLRRKSQCTCALGTFWALLVGLWSLALVGGPFLLLLARERRTRAALRE